MKGIHLERRYVGYDYLNPSICHMFMADDGDVRLIEEQFRKMCHSHSDKLSDQIRLSVVAYIHVFTDLSGTYYLTHIDGTEIMLRLQVIPAKDTIGKYYVGHMSFDTLDAEDAETLSHELFKGISKAKYLERYAERITPSSRWD